MATKPPNRRAGTSSRPTSTSGSGRPSSSAEGSSKSTTAGPARGAKQAAKKSAAGGALGAIVEGIRDAFTGEGGSAGATLTRKIEGTDALARSMPSNANKAAEHGVENAKNPPTGASSSPDDPVVTGSTITERAASPKIGSGEPPEGENRAAESLDRVRVDSGGQALTTNQGVQIADNQNSLKAGLRGPTLMEDFILREKITHFDHERIPERVVHARGSGAHGYFECYEPLVDVTRAAPFREAGKRTPVFVRFSTVAGERGSADAVRDVRGFAVKFYTDEGNWDLVGNNIPIFFIQDAMKFPDLVHAVKPEQHHAMPQAASAHDTFWDFASLMPESTHMLLWAMSDRAIPRSYRMMQGFGVHTYRLVNEAGETRFVKFHWTPKLGTHSLVWDEAVKINGADPDFHRRDLWEAIEAGEYPEYELGMQIFTEEEAERFSFDVLDATKIVPEELVPVRPVGRMVLNRNPDNFFAETEQVAFCVAHVVPGIDFSNDPLLAGRIHSYLDTQISRLGGPNFHEIPINAPVVPVHNNQRDGMHRQAIPRGRVAYEPNSLAGGCPFQAGMKTGFRSFPQPMEVEASKLRGKPEKFADHYTQATLFWESQTPVEQTHIVKAFRFELTKVQTPAIRERVVSMLANVAEELAAQVAQGLGFRMPAPMPKAIENPAPPEVARSDKLSLFAFPGDGGVRTRRVAIVVGDGADAQAVQTVYDGLTAEGAVARYVGVALGQVSTAGGDPLPVEITFETAPSVTWDGVVVATGDAGAAMLVADGQVLEFVRDTFRHCKPILALGAASMVLDAADVPPEEPAVEEGESDPGLIVVDGSEAGDAVGKFTAALAQHRIFARETDPPLV
jgi:catalase